MITLIYLQHKILVLKLKSRFFWKADIKLVEIMEHKCTVFSRLLINWFSQIKLKFHSRACWILFQRRFFFSQPIYRVTWYTKYRQVIRLCKTKYSIHADLKWFPCLLDRYLQRTSVWRTCISQSVCSVFVLSSATACLPGMWLFAQMHTMK